MLDQLLGDQDRGRGDVSNRRRKGGNSEAGIGKWGEPQKELLAELVGAEVNGGGGDRADDSGREAAVKAADALLGEDLRDGCEGGFVSVLHAKERV